MTHILKHLCKGIIRLYQLILSPWLGTCCRFEPSCSRYGAEAIEQHGTLKGCWLTLKRLLRCHPFAKHHGFDPVPPKQQQRPAHQPNL